MPVYLKNLMIMILPVVGLSIVALASFVLQARGDKRFLNAIHFLLFAAVSSIFMVQMGEADRMYFWALLGMVALNFALSHLAFLRKDFLRALGPLVSAGLVLFLLKGNTFDFLGEQGVFVNKFFVTALIITALGYELVQVKLKVIAKLFGEQQEEDIARAILILFSGLAVFLGSFQSGSIGLLAIAGMYVSTTFYREKDGRGLSVSLMALPLIAVLMNQAGETAANLGHGDVLEGVFLGGFAMYLIQKLWMAPKRSMVLILAGYAIGLILAFGVLFLATQFVRMGGMDALVGVLVGASLTYALVGKEYVGASFIPLLIAGGLVLPRFMINEDQEAFEEVTVVTDDQGNVVEDKDIPLADVAGSYTIVSDSSRVSFQLGENGETKGAFKKVTGSVEISENVADSKFDITLKMADFTTFNEIRDESLMSDEYFDAPKNPIMTYKGSKLVDKGDGAWEIQGNFTMLGVTKSIPVTVKSVDADGRRFLVGKGTIDRTQFGMQPSTAEGNVVTFEYRVLIR